MLFFGKKLMAQMFDYARKNYKIQIHHLCRWAKGLSNKKYAAVKAITMAKLKVLEKSKQNSQQPKLMDS